MHDLEALIAKADKAINEEDFGTAVEIYSENGALVIKPDLIVNGREQIQEAIVAIAQHFGGSLNITQEKMRIIEADGVALVLAKTSVASDVTETDIRDSIYVFKQNESGVWQCVIDNSYGHGLLDENT